MPGLKTLDDLLKSPPKTRVGGWRQFVLEFALFVAKEARACLFAGLFFGAVFLVPRAGILGLPKYDCLLLIALAIQVWMIASGNTRQHGPPTFAKSEKTLAYFAKPDRIEQTFQEIPSARMQKAGHNKGENKWHQQMAKRRLWILRWLQF